MMPPTARTTTIHSTEYHGSGLYTGQGQGLGLGVSHGVGQGQYLGSMDTVTATTTTTVPTAVPSTYNSPRQKPRHPVEDIDDCESVTLDPVIPYQSQVISQPESVSKSDIAVTVAVSDPSSTLVMETLDPSRNLSREIFIGRETGISRDQGREREREKEMEREIEIIRESRRGSVNVTEGVNERLRSERRASYPIPESTPAVPASLESSIADLADIMTALSAARTSIIIKKDNPNRRKKINSTDISPSSSASSSPSSTSTPSSPPSSEEGK